MTDIRSLISTFGPYKKFSLLVLVVIMISALMNALSIGIILPVFEFFMHPDKVDSGSIRSLSVVLRSFSKEDRLWIFCIIILLIFLLKNSFTLLEVYLRNYFSLKLREYWSNRIASKYLYGPLRYIRTTPQGILLNNFLREPFSAARFLVLSLNLISISCITISVFTVALMVNWQFMLLCSIVGLLTFSLFAKTSHRYSTLWGGQRVALWQDITAQMAENLSGINTLKVFSLEEIRKKNIIQQVRLLCQLNVKLEVSQNAPKAVSEILVVSMLVFLAAVYHAVLQGDLTSMLPQIAFFAVSFHKLFQSVSQIFSLKMKVQSLKPSLDIVHALSHEAELAEKNDIGLPISSLDTAISVENLCYQHEEDRPLFNKLNVNFPHNKISFLIGDSGSGKSTLVDIILGLYSPRKGAIRINDHSLCDYKLDDWRKMIGYVGQDVFLFNETVRDNILLYDKGLTEKDMTMSAKAAGVHDFIVSLPNGYDTVLGDRGLTISGGERQRITIARALVRNPQILIFDEATSSLDQEIEKKIIESIQSVFSGKTVLFITHRLATTIFADHIFKFDNGNIKELHLDQINTKKTS